MKPCYFLFILLIISACSKQQPATPDAGANSIQNPAAPPPKVQTPSGYDFEANGIPKFATANYIELSKIEKISKFRSGEGHDYSDSFEQCRSMKHYYQPYFNISDWGVIKIYSPVAGAIVKVDDEWAGKQVHIMPDNYPDFKVILFHVNLNTALVAGSKVTAGQQLGTHISSATSSDITISINTTKGFKLISWFDVMTDQLFNEYKSRGMLTRTDAIISKNERDLNPLSCSGEAFANKGTIENWVNLN
jgi:hypothetical protein